MRRALRRWGWRDWLVLATLLAVAATSLLPWFGRSVDWTDRQTVRFDASAWSASTWWIVAVLLAVAGGAGWLVIRLLGRFETVAGLSALVLVTASIWLTAHRWHSLGQGHSGRLVLVIRRVGEPLPKLGALLPHEDPHALYAIHRDRLTVGHNPGYVSDVRYGLYLGLVAMGLLALMLIAALATHRARADVGEPG